ncbi:hypothetical protein S8c_00059 [Klebsiella phage VLCpiS8c]|nr:hypothetical protein S8c_00059 [Klebsiella phage VLCpiS8c]
MIALIVVFLLAVDCAVERFGVGTVTVLAILDLIVDAAADAIPVLLLNDKAKIHADADSVDLGVRDVAHPW